MNWPSLPIESVSVPTSVRDPRRGPASSFRYIDISAVDRHTKSIATAPEIPSANAPSRARKAVLAGAILVSTVRPNLNTVALVPPALDDQIASTGFCVLRPNPKVILGKYLFYFSTTPEFVDALTSKVRGAHYPAISDADVKSVSIPVPPLSEQRRIVEILDQADALRKKRAEADAQAARIRPALFYEMFGDPTGNRNKWEHDVLGNILEQIDSGWSPTCTAEPAETNQWGVLKLGAVTTCDIPDSSIQETFASRVFETHALREQQTEDRHRIDSLFSSLLHRAFSKESTIMTGKI